MKVFSIDINNHDQYDNLIKSNKEDSNQFECGQRFLSIMLIFFVINLCFKSISFFCASSWNFAIGIN